MHSTSIRTTRASATGIGGRDEFGGTQLVRCTVCIVGLGPIGRALAEYVRPFGSDIVAYDPHVSAERAEELGTESVELTNDSKPRISSRFTSH